ncbi:protein of unknown function [Chitinophaga arvensicola]|uniref:FecR protein n=2 Tax=Chitinophaga arvensicola TaxID=29529 RepID=A0A1I0R408_9BACT|nr:protein of unknown function [Chitinophaga arvensicola]
MTPDFEQLLTRFLDGTLSPEEVPFFLESGNKPANQEVLRQVLMEKLQGKAYTGLSNPADIHQLFAQMMERAQPVIIPLSRYQRYRRWGSVAAAVVLITAGTAFFRWQQHHRKTPAPAPIVAAVKNTVTPGGNKAMLTLSNGTTILLDSAANGTLAMQGSTSVVKLTNGQLSYQGNGVATAGELLYNTMSTPRGGQYQVTLPDGTRVWLNASSSISYPTAFPGRERKVTVKGEAYFEVAHNAQQPFKVVVNGVAVDVLGTHFNVNGYGDEAATRITLLEGSVKISKGLTSAMLKPGQQALVAGNDNIQFNNGVEVEEAVAWKNGLFWFNGVDLPGIMRQLSRWYDIEVEYEGAIPQRHFTGHVFRDLSLTEVLKILELSHVHFRLEGRKLIVTP